MDIAEIGFGADTSELKDARKELDGLPGATKRAEDSVDRLGGSFDRANRRAGAFEKALEGVFYRLGRGIGNELKNAVAGFALLFGVGSFLNKIHATAEALDAVSKASKAVNSSTQEMQALATAGDLAGTSFDAIAAATRRMNRVLAQAQATGKGTQGVFKLLGISASELINMPVSERFAAIADRIQQLGLDASQTTYVLSLLGDRTGGLIGLMGQGGDQIRQAADDVNKFNLAITSLQGEQIEEMNDNLTRLGYAAQGAFNQFVATIAPAASAAFIGIANAIAFVVQNGGFLLKILEALIPVMAVAFGPAIVGAVWAFAVAVGTGAVSAVVALSAAIAANPLGALAIAVTTIIGLIWAFRDDISKIFGIDVPGIFKAAGNFIIQTFMVAFEQIKWLWGTLPNIMGSATVSAVNLVIDGLNTLIKGSIDGLNGLINSIPKELRFGLTAIDGNFGQIEKMKDGFAAAAQAGNEAYGAAVKTIAATDYVGQLASAFSDLSTATETTKVATDGAGMAFEDFNAKAGKTPKVLTDVKSAAREAFEKLSDLRQEVLDNVSGAFKSFFTDIMHGKSAIDSLTDALGNLADKLMSMVLDNAISGILGGLFGANPFGALGNDIGPGATLGGLQSFLASAKGNAFGYGGVKMFARGGVVSSPTMFGHSGGLGMMGEAGPEAILPLQRGVGGVLGVAANSNGGASGFMLSVNIYNNAANDVEASATMDDDGSLNITIDKIMAKNVADPGSKTNGALRRATGARNAVVTR